MKKQKPIGGWLGQNFKAALPLVKAGVLIREFKGVKPSSPPPSKKEV